MVHLSSSVVHMLTFERFMIKRIDTLDYLRGLMACGIMVYHCTSWTYGPYSAANFWGKVGLYGVAVFYVLSGLTLFEVYKDRMSGKGLVSYGVKRVFRIFPLLWLTILLSIFLLDQEHSTRKLILNFTGAFGFVDPGEYIPAGAWSIGNELVFYAFFPLIIVAQRWYRYTLEVVFGVSLAYAAYLGFTEFGDSETLAESWQGYINPFNQICLFTGGMLIGKLFSGKTMAPKYALGGIALVVLAFIVYPGSGDLIDLVSGPARVYYLLLCFLLTWFFFGLKINWPKVASWVLENLGKASYSIYLLHPIVFWQVAEHIDRTQTPKKFLVFTFAITLTLSYLVYHFYEKQFVRLGKLVSKKLSPKS